MKTNQIIVGIAILVIGFGLGYVIRGDRESAMGNHMMSNGNMMGDHMTGGSSMQSMMDGMMANLEGKTGDEFDKAFLSEMIVHHQGAVKMAASVLKNSQRAELKELANDIISAQEKEVSMMKNWQKEWFNR